MAISPSWTFEHALLLLREHTADKMLSGCLAEFLKTNEHVLTRGGLAFVGGKSDRAAKSFSVRGVQYESRVETELVEEVARRLEMDTTEVARIMAIASQRVPEAETLRLQEFRSVDSDKSDKLAYYYSRVLREQRVVVELRLALVRSPQNSGVKSALSKDYTQIDAQLDAIEWIFDRIRHLSGSALSKIIRQEWCLTLVDLLSLTAYLILGSEKGFAKATVLRWFQLMQKTGWMSKVQTAELAEKMEALATAVTLLFLDLDFNFGSLQDNASYMNDPEDLWEITGCIAGTVANPVVMYAWTIVLHRKHTVMEMHPENSRAVAIISKFKSLQTLEKTYLGFAAQAESLHVLSALLNCHKTLAVDPVFSDILGSFVVACVPYLKMTDETTADMAEILQSASDDIIQRFFSDPSAQEMIALARAKLPLSLRSFISLVGINTNLALEEFRTFGSYMEVLPHSDFDYKYSIDDENPDLVKLVQDVDVYPPYERGKKMSLLLKKGTKAQLFPASKASSSVVVAFCYQYSGWGLLGRILKNLSVKLGENSDRIDLIVAIFRLLAKVFAESDQKTTDDVTASLDAFIGENDTVEIVLRILDQALVLREVPLLAASLDLLSVLTRKGRAFRVWSHLYKSQLVCPGLAGRGLAATVTGTVEMISGDFSFTVALLKLTGILVEDCISVDRKVSRKLKSQVILRLVTHFTMVFENYTNWKYTVSTQRTEIGTLCASLFDSLFTALYGVDESAKPENRVNSTFLEACTLLEDRFLSQDASPAIKPILSLIDLTASSFAGPSSDWLSRCFGFCTTLLKIKSPSALAMALYTRLPNLVNVYLNNPDKRQLVAELLTVLVSAKWEGEPPSLLTHLRQTHTDILLWCLSVDLANHMESYGLKVALYDFFSAVMQGNQEGLTIVLITGKDVKSRDSRGSLSLLKILEKDVGVIQQYPAEVGLHMAEAIALAFSSWASAQQDSDSQFIEKLLAKLDEPVESAESAESGYQLRVLSKIVHIVSLYLYVTPDKAAIIRKLNSAKLIGSLAAHFQIRNYKQSLQANVAADFHNAWPQFQLQQFVRSSAFKDHRYRVDSVYSFPLLERLVGTDSQWAQLKGEIEEASNNIQSSSAQVEASRAFAALITCFCKVSDQLDPAYLKLAYTLLQACSEEGVPSDALFGEIYHGRIELAFYICLSFSKRPNYKPPAQSLFKVLTSASRLLESKEIDFKGALRGTSQSYRPLLRTILLCVQMPSADWLEYSASLGDIFADVICQPITLLLDSIRTSALGRPDSELGKSPLVAKQVEDLALLLSILKSFLSSSLPKELDQTIAKCVINSGLFRAIVALYSVSHLVKVDGEEVFADYTLMLLAELVQNKAVAHTLVLNGLFSVLVESPISVRIQAGSVKPYPISRSRLQHLWADGLLPIALQLLALFKDAVLSEACLFATAFSKQINSTVQAWFDSDSSICTQSIEETSEIILLAKSLNTLDAYNYVRSSVEVSNVSLAPGLDTAAERHKLSSALGYLISHPKYLSLRIVPSSPEEKHALESDPKFIERVIGSLKVLRASLE